MTESDKPHFRESLKTVLRGTAADDRAGWSSDICGHLRESEVWSKAATVMIFAATRYEPDLLPLISGAAGRRLIFPAMLDSRIEPRVVATAEELFVSRGGIREPLDGVPVRPGEIDLILVPGLGFTPGGLRLGRGRGDYDRFLPGLRPEVPLVGTAFACQLREDLPAGPLDVRMTAVLTEKGFAGVRFLALEAG